MLGVKVQITRRQRLGCVWLHNVLIYCLCVPYLPITDTEQKTLTHRQSHNNYKNDLLSLL